ncbi:MAG: prolyl oligopeptidase family serine peptidase [Gemmatimonadetes bacterium]|nr:prolyl oligopeptidase family serine peptidase [Gemmatimonadota bacterium]
MRSALRFTTLLAALFLAVAAPAATQQQAPDTAKRALTLADYGPWSRINQVALSPDGRWLAYAKQPNEGDATFVVKSLDDTATYDFVNGSGAEFTDDGRWVAFLTSPPKKEADELRKQKKPVQRTLHVIDLETGTTFQHPGVREFAFSDDGRFLAIHRERADRQADFEGSDLLLRDLSSGTLLSLGNVSAFAFNKGGSRLAYLVDAANKGGDGLYLLSPADGRIRPLDTDTLRYDDLTWDSAGTDVAALKGEKPKGKAQRANALLVARGVTGTTPAVKTYDPAGDASFPEDFVLSELGNTTWTKDGGRILLGIKEQEDEAKRPENGEERANVDVWHWNDDRIQSVQMRQAAGDRRFTYTSVYNVDSGRFLRLATEDMQRVQVTEDGRWGVGSNDAAYRHDLNRPDGYADYVRIDLNDGQTAELVKDLHRPMGTSPDGKWFLYLADGKVQAIEIATLKHTDLSTSAGVDFVNHEFDQVDEAPAWGVGGWTRDGSVLLYTKWDVWQVPANGGKAVNVTNGVGEAQQIQFRVQDLDRAPGFGRFRGGGTASFVDPKDMVLSAYGEWTKKSGYYKARPGKDPQVLIYDDEMIGGVRKAENADRVVFTRQTFQEFPDYWVSDLRFSSPRKVTDANPQISEFLWGKRVLVDYIDKRGNKLQATLTLPAGYEQGKKYPMIIYFYEKMSQNHHLFSQPVYDDRPHMSTYASNGYLVLMPDIIYDRGLPGSSALDDVTAAAQEVIDLGYADPAHIGLQGHSWGGYETSFILTQTDMFACIVTGAPLTDLMSMDNILYKQSGSSNGPILQWSQGRMGDTPWDDGPRWRSQSPIEHVPDIETPFLILQGTADGAVDWNQGLELYSAARRLGKKVILLSYPDEPHHLSKEPNQKDFQIRMKQFFDHYLMGAPEPEWMAKGVTFLQKGKVGPDGKEIS